MRAKCLAGTDQSIKGYLRKGIKTTIRDYLEANSFEGCYIIFDERDGSPKKLIYRGLHKGIIRRDGFYANCSDFSDTLGNVYNIDFLVAKKEDTLYVMKALMHYFDKVKGETKVEEV